MSQSNIYLGKNGRVFGPFTQLEYQQMEQSGDLNTYRWIWNTQRKIWDPIDPPPPPVEATQGATSPGRSAPKARLKIENILAVCHDFHRVVSGKIAQATEAGCELITQDSKPSPSLATQSNVFLNLFDQKTGKSINVKAQLFGISRSQGGWTYRIRWNQCPSLG